jgi:peptide/nickel transport system permease protein
MELDGSAPAGLERRHDWLTQFVPEEYQESVYIFFTNPVAVAGLLIVIAWLLVAVLADRLAPYPNDAWWATNTAIRLQPPSAEHLFGTDHLGRDIYSRVLIGSRTSISSGLFPILAAVLIGVPMGAIAGFFGGKLETLIMRTADVLLALPNLVLAIAITAVLGPSLRNAMLAMIIVWWPSYTRVIYGQTLALKQALFVEAARGLGISNLEIIRQHVLPNCTSTIIVMFTMDLGFGILTMASLGFVGVGAQPPDPEWGLAVSIGRAYMPDWWWLTFFPGLAIFTIVMAFNVIGDGLRDALDPRRRSR